MCSEEILWFFSVNAVAELRSLSWTLANAASRYRAVNPLVTHNRHLSMDRPLLLDRLAMTERHIRQGERHLLRQHQIVAELELHGRGQSQTANMARDILQTFEMAPAAHIADRARLMAMLTVMTSA